MNDESSKELTTVADVRDSAERLRGLAVRTPLVEYRALNEQVGARILLKLETLQHTNSFKFRGAMNRLLRLSGEERTAGVVAWSSGNHAQAVALAASMLDIPATIVMPGDAPAVKLERTRRFGATVVTYRRDTESREEISYRLASERGLTVVPSFDDRWVIAGQGSAGIEVVEQCLARDVQADEFLICCGGGGLTAGCALAMETAESPPAVWTVEPEDYDDHRRSFASGRRESVAGNPPSICDALLSPSPGEMTFAINRERVAGGLAVGESAVRSALRYAFEELRLVIEPGGAVVLAKLLSEPERFRGKTVIGMVSGGNVDPALFAEIIGAA